MAMGATQSTARRGPASCSALLEQVLVFGGGGRCMATSTVAFGLQLPVQSQSTLYAQPWEAAAGVPEVVAVARACDSAGFAYIAVCAHLPIPAPLTAAMGPTWWDTGAPLSYLADIGRAASRETACTYV